MTLQSSGAISLSQVNTELGLSSTATISLNDAAVRSLAGVASGQISLSNLYGKSSVTVNFGDSYPYSYSYFQATAEYQIVGAAASGLTVGHVYSFDGATNTDEGAWITPASAAGDYEVYATYTGTTPTGSALNTWVATSSNPYWYLQTVGNATQTCTITLQVRKVGTTTVLDTWTVSIYASSFF